MSLDAGRLRKPEETQSSFAEVQLDKGDLGRQRLPAKAVRQWCRRSSADFGSPSTIFHQIMGHCSHALKNLDPGLCTRFRRMNPYFADGPNVTRISQIMLEQQMGSDPVTLISRNRYEYYGSEETHGKLGDLKRVQQQRHDATQWVTTGTHY